ncbi:MAG TPA: chloride channel protein, partial [Flavisolibacter sp.]|nr:chloride channel protein [Flavisolibacter sp.]
ANLNEQRQPSDFLAGKKRLLYISLLAVILGSITGFVAKGLVMLINLFTHLFFYHQFSFAPVGPAANHLGLWVIAVPAIGGIIVGFMALYGSAGIRGHGITEAMEKILVNESKIRPSITYLKPLSSAISIGTGGPFGAEGPIIATGGALGSTLGQILRISAYERKILLAAGATAGMSAIFGTPVASIFLAIELLLFEFSARSIIPVALACITATAGHHLLFESGPVFPMPFVSIPSNEAIAAYSVIGIIIGLVATLITKAVYLIEDGFEKLPIHWKWWPAIGGLIVGVIGYFVPKTLGVGYDNITDILSGKMVVTVVAVLGLMKLVSWAFSLGSGTSGGTLAPLLTIGGAAGVLLGVLILHLFPKSGVVLPLAALIGMSSMFAGASRALLTSIVFAIESTGQTNALLPLLAASIASYCISFFLMENTIMTEKMARRGVRAPHTYQPDPLEKLSVQQVAKQGGVVLGSDLTIQEAREWLQERKDRQSNYYIIATDDGDFRGIVSASNLYSLHHEQQNTVETLIKRKPVAVTNGDSLKTAVDIMAAENVDVLPVVNAENNKITGILSYKDILSAYRLQQNEHEEEIAISVRRQTLKLLVHGKKGFSFLKEKVSK